MGKPAVSKDERSKQLDYYYKVARKKRLEKVKCNCGRIVSQGNLKAHKKSDFHIKQLIKVQAGP